MTTYRDLVPKTNRKPHSDNVGYVCELRNRATGIGHVVIYDRNKGFDADADGRYVVVCETHGTMVSETSLPRARMSMKSVEFCEECQRLTKRPLDGALCTCVHPGQLKDNICQNCGLPYFRPATNA